MSSNLLIWLASAWELLLKNGDWMAWNLFLALLPFALSVWLFRPHRSRSYLWWIGLLLLGTFLPKAPFIASYMLRFIRDNRTNYFVWAITLVLIILDMWLLRRSRSRSFSWWVCFLIFIAFLPNAPYVLTDIIHLITDIRETNSVWLITLVLIPQYLLFILIGLEAYVLSLIYMGEYLKQNSWGKFVTWVELLIHALSAVGIYLGRFLRFNSWDLVTDIDNVANTVIDDLTAKRPLIVIIVTFVIITVLYWLMKQVSLGIMLKNTQRNVLASEE